MARDIKTILVLGVGVMGNGIAHLAAQAGYTTKVYDIKQEFVDRGINNIRANLSRGLKKGRITEEQIEEIMSRISGFISLEEAAKDVDFVIEAIVENIELKVDVFKKLNSLLPEDVIFVTNTSTISISLLGGGSERPERFMGMHFFNPAPVMKLCELTQGIQTNSETVDMVRSVGEKFGKEVILAKDSPGFIVNRILLPMLNEAIFALQDGVGSVEDIDKGIKLGLGHPMGPFTLLDLIGLDTHLHVSMAFYEGFNDPKYRVAPLLKNMVAAGLLGKKSGHGFYKYDE